MAYTQRNIDNIPSWKSDANKKPAILNRPRHTPQRQLFQNNIRPKYDNTSYGMILCGKVNGEIKYGLVKKRACYGVGYILAGDYKPEYFTEVSLLERQMFQDVCLMKNNWIETFKFIYCQLNTGDFDEVKFINCMNRFMSNREYLLTMFQSQSIYPLGNWEFPKGRMEKYGKIETPQACALREMQEETFIIKENVVMLPMRRFDEQYGWYKSSYFVGYLQEEYIKSVEFEKGETSELRWCSFEEAMENIPDIIAQRKEILKKINDNIHHFI